VRMTIHLQISHKSNNINNMKYVKMHNQKYYRRKLNNNKLKYDNHAITKYSISNHKTIESYVLKMLMLQLIHICTNDSLNKIKHNSRRNVFLNKGNKLYMSKNKQPKLLELIFSKIKEFNPYFMYYQKNSSKYILRCVIKHYSKETTKFHK